jgi:hypothetical protein
MSHLILGMYMEYNAPRGDNMRADMLSYTYCHWWTLLHERETIRFGPKSCRTLLLDFDEMYQRQCACFWPRKGWTRAVHIELEVILHEKAVGYSIVTKYLRSARFRERDAVQADSENNSDANLVGQEILQALAFQPFTSIPQISRMILLSKFTVYRHLTESLGFILKRLRWAIHRLSGIEKEAKVEKSEELLQRLLSMKHQSCKYIVTLDEAWFHLCPNYATIWLARGEPRPDMKRLSKIGINSRLQSSWFSCAWLSPERAEI